MSNLEFQQKKCPELNYAGVVYNAVDLDEHKPEPGGEKDDYLVYLSRVCQAKGTHHAVRIARENGYRLVMAGKIDAGEDILACARRELQEETGYVGAEWRHLGVMHPCIGYSDERIEIFLATGLQHVGHAWDEGEFLEIIRMPLAEARAAVFDGRITDAKTITALFWAEHELAG